MSRGIVNLTRSSTRQRPQAAYLDLHNEITFVQAQKARDDERERM